MVTASKQMEFFKKKSRMKGRGLGGNLRFPPRRDTLD
jgi:hypothetical protein